MNLSEVFDSVAIKNLVNVDLPDNRSNQHEINGVSSLRDLKNSCLYISFTHANRFGG